MWWRRALQPRGVLSSRSPRRCLSTSIGFIGLGHMGAPMAGNLVRGGKALTVYDVHRPAVDKLVEQGAAPGQDIAAVAGSSDIIFTMLRSPEQVREVSATIMENAKGSTILVDCSTIDPMTARAVSAAAEAKGMSMIDAPVSGGVTGAANATLTFMVGGNRDAVERVKPLLSLMGRNTMHCGASGNGQVAKLTNNLILAISMIGVSEGMNLGIQMGIDPQVLANVINTSTGRCWSSDTYNPVPGIIKGVPSSNDYKGGFGCALMLKDLRLALQAAQEVNAETPLATKSCDVYEYLCETGYADRDFSVIYDQFRQSTTQQRSK
ncbi:3-hydroxyisobutyrate dehydrogenase [Plasmodiophora brassicae]|uniref:3-hydroxyisobutyrate dehydrogenase n=1 Tax=Plasmodiophora brassicae TaxID=37360 RepID=A0A0G4IW16_PLABS|nr:hypothetical protein PBRA_001344 [Plasmodiophora brassicae]SPQ97443.1 unnamed protein product [Plasmodiophora brassicae]